MAICSSKLSSIVRSITWILIIFRTFSPVWLIKVHGSLPVNLFVMVFLWSFIRCFMIVFTRKNVSTTGCPLMYLRRTRNVFWTFLMMGLFMILDSSRVFKGYPRDPK